MDSLKFGTLIQRAQYAAVKAIRDFIVAGTGVSAASVIAYVLGNSMDPETAAVVSIATLGAWRIVRERVIDFLTDLGGGDVSDGPVA